MDISLLAERSGIHARTLRNIEEGNIPLHSYSIINSIAEAFGVPVYKMAGEPIYDVQPTILMSSASMPNDGFYHRESISIDHFIRIVRGAWLIGNLKSYVGYDLTANYVERLTGAKAEKTRQRTRLIENGMCQIAICKLRFRLGDKDQLYIPEYDDFEYVSAKYNSKSLESLAEKQGERG